MRLPYISQLSLTRKVGWGVEVERTGRTAHTHIHRDTSWLIYGINFIHMTICCQQEKVKLGRLLRRAKLVEGDGFNSRGIGRSLQMVANWTSIPSDVPSPARASINR
jgi:hypothetical protein